MKCYYCKENISISANICPYCKEKVLVSYKIKEYKNLIFFVVFFGVISLISILMHNSESKPSEKTNSPSILSLLTGIDTKKTNSEDLYKSIVYIKYTDTINGNEFGGSGIIFSKDGLILTNNHIVENPDFGTAFGKITICITKDVEEKPECNYTANIVVRNSVKDLAILKINNYFQGNYVNLFESNIEKKDYVEKKVKVLGYPGLGGDKITITKGIIAGFDDNYNLKTDAEINHGNSGGGSFDEDNNFIGIPSFIVSTDSGKIGYIIPKYKIFNWFKEILGKNIDFKTTFSSYIVNTGSIVFEGNNTDAEGTDEKVIPKFARIETNTNDFNGILAKAKEIIAIRPQSPLVYEYLGNAYMNNEKYEDAITFYKASLSLNPNKKSTIRNYAICLGEVGRYEEAMKLYESLLSYNDNNDKYISKIYNNIGYLYGKMGNTQEAKDYYTKALQYDSANNMARKNIDIINNTYNYNYNKGNYSEGNQVCKNNFGPFSYYMDYQNSNGNYLCNCEAGYIFNDSQTYCIKDTVFDNSSSSTDYNNEYNNYENNGSENSYNNTQNNNGFTQGETWTTQRDVNIRTEPGTRGVVIQSLAQGNQVQVISKQRVDGYDWYYIKFYDVVGRIHSVAFKSK